MSAQPESPCLIDPVPWQGVSAADREALETMGATFGVSADVLRLAFRLGMMSGSDLMLRLLIDNPQEVRRA